MRTPQPLPRDPSTSSPRFAIAAVVLGVALGVCGCAELRHSGNKGAQDRGGILGVVANVLGVAGGAAQAAGDAVSVFNPIAGGALVGAGSLLTIGAQLARRRFTRSPDPLSVSADVARFPAPVGNAQAIPAERRPAAQRRTPPQAAAAAPGPVAASTTERKRNAA